jgi:hypothetical protein
MQNRWVDAARVDAAVQLPLRRRVKLYLHDSENAAECALNSLYHARNMNELATNYSANAST